MAKKKDSAPVTAPTARNPEQWIGLDHGATGDHEYRELPLKGERAITVDGTRYEHVADDADGCWLYRGVRH